MLDSAIIKYSCRLMNRRMKIGYGAIYQNRKLTDAEQAELKWIGIRMKLVRDVAAANNQEMKTSISNALLDMVIQGLSPAKKQCYFIKYGNKVQLMRSYFGTMAVLDRVTGGADITPVVVRKGDDFQVGMDGPNMVVTKHDTSFENLDNEIVAAYVVIKLANGKETTTVMTKKQIDQSWSKSKMKGSGPQKEFPEEMAKRTVINRAAKGLINTSNDNDLFVQAAKDTLENEFDDREIKQAEPVKVQAIENKLQRKMGIKQAEPVEQDHTVEDLMKPKETIEQEPEEQSVDLESLEEADPVQEDLGIIPNFDREEGADDEGILKAEDYPF